jgi:cytochrome c biogenesis protein CcdA
MPSSASDDARRSGSQFSLGWTMTVIAVLALVLSIVSRAARSGSHQDWGIVVLSFGVFLILAIPILLLGLVIRHSPSSRDDERDVIGLVVKTLLLIMLLSLSVFINRL